MLIGTIVILKPKTRKGKNRISNFPNSSWSVIQYTMKVQFDTKGGPWYLISNQTHTQMFWVHGLDDEHFTME